MGFYEEMLIRHDWAGTIRAGVELAGEHVKQNVDIQEYHVMWELLRQAAQVSRLTYKAPPRQGYPSKSAMPDAPDDVSEWAAMMAYVRGEVEEKPETKSRPPIPSTKEVTRSDVILHLWHSAALIGKPKRKKAVYLLANDLKGGQISLKTGISRQQMHRDKKTAMQEMWDAMRVY